MARIIGSNTGMSFLSENDLKLAQKGEFQFGFRVFGKKKKKGVGWLETENKMKKTKKNNKRNLLEVSGYWA